MGAAAKDDVTRWLLEWSTGDREALTKLLPMVYDELHRLASSYMQRERPGHTLQPTALVHEAFLKLVDQRRIEWRNRAQFFGVAAQVMRRILVDHARARQGAKRGGDAPRISLDESAVASHERPPELIELDAALQRLTELDERKGKVIELRLFGGLTIDEAAEVLGVSTGTVINDYKLARAWLYRELRREPVHGP